MQQSNGGASQVLVVQKSKGDDVPFVRGVCKNILDFEEVTNCENVQANHVGAFIMIEAIADVTVQLFSGVAARVVPGGSITTYVMQADVKRSLLEEAFTKSALYSGLIDVTMKMNDGLQVMVCKKPDWTSTTATLDGDIVGIAKNDDKLIDEDALLEGVEPYVPMAKGKSDCSSKPRACANCTCGRAELEAEVGAEEAKKRLEVGLVRSSCGSCYKGDAFRCAGCPYKGQPAFKPGDKVKLDVDSSNVGQVNGVLANGGDEAVTTTSTDGKLRIVV